MFGESYLNMLAKCVTTFDVDLLPLSKLMKVTVRGQERTLGEPQPNELKKNLD